MRLNETGINQMADEIKHNFPYLLLGFVDKGDGAEGPFTVYDGTTVTNPLLVIPVTEVSVVDNVLHLTYELSVLALDGKTINCSALCSDEEGDTVLSFEVFDNVEKDDKHRWRWRYRVNLLR